MTAYERYIKTLNGQPADFLPRTPLLMQFAAEYINSDYASFASDYRTLVKANAVCAKDFGIDQLSCISDPYRETHGFGSAVTYVKDGPPRSTHPLADRQDLSLLKTPDPLRSERMLDRVQAVEAYHREFDKRFSILGWVEGPAAEAADLRDVTNFLMDMMDDVPFACDLMDRCTDVAINFAKTQVKAGADTIGIGDAIASQVSPDVYEELIQPREKKLVKAIQDAGAYVKLHICGNITHLLPAIADLNVDILDVDHMVNLRTVREAVGCRTALAGNIDPVATARNGSPDAIRSKILRCYEEAGNPYLVSAGCEIPAGTPLRNLKALCEPIPYRI
jgi:MtaA/CmuA family methyltransferase